MFWLLVALIMSCSSQLVAQDNAGAAKPFLEKLQQAYRNAAWLNYQVKYLYANASQPGKHIDSLSGTVQMDKNRSRYVLDGTEIIVTDKYTINIDNEGKTIYLGAVKSGPHLDPAVLLDSVLEHLQGVRTVLTTMGKSDVLTIDFPPGQAYMRMQIAIDRQTGLLQRIGYDLRTENWLEKEQVDRPGHPAPYQTEGRVEMLFSHYQHGLFNDSLFNEGNFIYKVDGRFIPAQRYKDYHIYLASSNL